MEHAIEAAFIQFRDKIVVQNHGRVDSALERAPLASDPGPYLEALRIRLTVARNAIGGSDARNVMNSLVRTPEGLCFCLLLQLWVVD